MIWAAYFFFMLLTICLLLMAGCVIRWYVWGGDGVLVIEVYVLLQLLQTYQMRECILAYAL